MEPLNVECDLQSLRRLYGLLLSNANNEVVLLDGNTQLLLKRLLDSATEELLTRQTKVLAQAQLGLPERVSTPSTKNSVSRGIIRLPSKAGFTEEVVDSIQLIETQLSAFRFCSSRVESRGDRTRSWKSPSVVTTPIEEDYSSSGMHFQRLSEKALMERRQSYLSSSYMPASRQMSHTTRTSNVAPSLTSVNNNAAVRPRDDQTLALQSQGSCPHDDQIVLVRSRPPLPPRPVRSVGFEKPRQSNRTSQKMASMKPTLLDQGNETWDEDSIGNTRSGTSSEGDEQVSSTEQESEEASGETMSTSGSSWETHGESVTESDSSYPSESDDDDDDDDNSQVSDSTPHKRRDRSRDPTKRSKKGLGRLKRFKDKLGKVFHHHHHHHHHHHQNKKEEEGRKQSAWKHLVKKHLQKDKGKVAERRWKPESKGLTTHKNKGGQFHALVEGLMRHRRHSKKKKPKLQSHGRKMNWWETPKRQGGIKLPNGGRVKLGKTNYLRNKDQDMTKVNKNKKKTEL